MDIIFTLSNVWTEKSIEREEISFSSAFEQPAVSNPSQSWEEELLGI